MVGTTNCSDPKLESFSLLPEGDTYIQRDDPSWPRNPLQWVYSGRPYNDHFRSPFAVFEWKSGSSWDSIDSGRAVAFPEDSMYTTYNAARSPITRALGDVVEDA